MSGARHPKWLADRNSLMAAANTGECPSVEFDAACAAISVMEKAIIGTPAASLAEAAAKLQFCATIHGEGMVLDRDEAADLMADIAPFLAPVVERQAWDEAKAIYLTARGAERAYDAEYCALDLPAGPARREAVRRITPENWAQSQRLNNVTSNAEDVLMDIPSPDAAAFAFKCHVARGDGRETDCWNKMLDAEAKRFAGEA